MVTAVDAMRPIAPPAPSRESGFVLWLIGEVTARLAEVRLAGAQRTRFARAEFFACGRHLVAGCRLRLTPSDP
jgi:hypothetical protein